MSGHERDELDEARHQEIIKDIQSVKDSVEKNRAQSSQEHGSIKTTVDDQNRETRAHIGSEVETMRGDVALAKNFMGRLLKAMKRFMGRHGMGSDDL